jgi:hypothetical protein
MYLFMGCLFPWKVLVSSFATSRLSYAVSLFSDAVVITGGIYKRFIQLLALNQMGND